MADRIDPEAQTEAAPLVVPPRPASSTSSIEDGPPLVAGRYEVLGLVGAGAMGTVYRARDRELDEIVALKVLKKELARHDMMLDRFRREVKLARRVTHRNVARMYDIGEHGGDRFLTMEFIEGEGLGALLERRGMLLGGEAVALAMDVCAGLEAAHAANVLHRDLKPDNVIVASDGRAVITDFGIARATEADLSFTQGNIVGTPAYMAPEQVEGATDLDARADLYALGTMLYELVTGQPAWGGTSVIAVASARLLKPPPDPRVHLPGLPSELADVILKLMARRREDRFASAAETIAALKAIDGARISVEDMTAAAKGARFTSTPKKTIAVLPVVNLGSAEDAYLAENLTLDLADDLGMVPNVRMRPRGTTEIYTDPSRDVREIGHAHGVDVVVDASLRRIGEIVRASFRLVTVRDGFQLWAKRFDRAPTDVLAIAKEAAQEIAKALTAETPTGGGVFTKDPVATDLFLRGRYLAQRGWFDASRDGRLLLAQAYARAPDDARIAGTYALALAREFGNMARSRDLMTEARAVAEAALAIDNEQPEARVTIGVLHLYEGDPADAVEELRRALACAPNDVDALDALARIEGEVGLVEESFRHLGRALAVGGDRPRVRYQITKLRLLLEHESGMETSPVVQDPAELVAWTFLRARACTWRGDRVGAKRLGEWFESQPVRNVIRDGVLAALRITASGAISDFDRALIDTALPVDASRSRRNASFHAQLRTETFLTAGQTENALRELRAADAHGLIDVVWLERCRLLAPLRDDPVFERVLASTKARVQPVLDALRAPTP